MAATIIDSGIFGNIFSSDAMRHVWSDENRTAKYLEIEKALAVVQGRLGIIPGEAAAEIARNCDLARIDMDKLRGSEAREARRHNRHSQTAGEHGPAPGERYRG